MKESKRVVIVGASAAGLRCACRLRRLQPDWSITWSMPVRSSPTAPAVCRTCSPATSKSSVRCVERPTASIGTRRIFADVKSIEVLAPWRATAVDVEARTLHIEADGEERDLEWDELVIATGASPRRLPGFPDHPRVHTFHVWDDVKPLKIGLMQGEIDHVAVVGAGLVGVELAEAFHSLWGADVTLIEAAATPLPEILDPELGEVVARHLESNGVRVLTRSAVAEVAADDEGVTVTAGGEEVRADVVVVAVGVEPRVELARMAGAELGPTRAIRVDERLQTTVPHVWAAGDCVEYRHVATGGPAYLPLGSLANRQGRVLADVLAGGTRPSDRWLEPRRSRSSISTWRRSVAPPPVSAATVWVSARSG